MNIAGLQKTSIIDYQHHVCCVVFLSGCNFRCGFCHNPELVLGIESSPPVSAEDFFSFLKDRQKWLDAVCITGGEPTLSKDLQDFIRKIKLLGYKVKLDSNGTNPKVLEELFKNNLIDYIAMDIKTILNKYESVVNATVDLEKIQQSISLIMNSGIDYEFRTTVVPGLHCADDFEKVGEWLHGAKRFVVQNFRPGKCLNKKFEKILPFSKKDIESFKVTLEKNIDEVLVR